MKIIIGNNDLRRENDLLETLLAIQDIQLDKLKQVQEKVDEEFDRVKEEDFSTYKDGFTDTLDWVSGLLEQCFGEKEE